MLAGLGELPGHGILPFHRRWLTKAYGPKTEIAALSCPRGSAKSWLMGRLLALALRPGSATWREGIEVLGVSASLAQSRIVLGFVKEALAPWRAFYRTMDSTSRLEILHKPTGTRLRILSSSGKRAMGLSQFSLIVADEPASWETRGGALMYDALRQSLGKLPGQRLFMIGTRAPAEPGNWWPELLDAGSQPGRHVEVFSAPRDEPWDSYHTVARVNPLVRVSPSLRRTVLRERDEARKNPTLRPAYEAYRLNRQVEVYADVLVQVEDWQRVEAREVPPRAGRPIVGIDMGGERAWSAAWCLWKNGRSECYALAPGIPSLAERERQDAMPRGLYRKLHADGVLEVEEGFRVSKPETLFAALVSRGIRPRVVFCDRFMVGPLRDAVAGRWPLEKRVTRWSEATEDVAAFRQLVKDGPLSLVPECRALAQVSIGQASVLSDDQGSVRLQKRRHGRSRDDVAVAGVLAAGALVRELRRGKVRSWRYAGAV